MVAEIPLEDLLELKVQQVIMNFLWYPRILEASAPTVLLAAPADRPFHWGGDAFLPSELQGHSAGLPGCPAELQGPDSS